MRHESHPYHLPAVDIARTRGAEATAGLFFLDGRCHFAAYRSPAAHALVERGALHVATLRFDRDPLERSHPGHPVRTLESLAAVRRFPPGPESS